jgi:hypothetical protein
MIHRSHIEADHRRLPPKPYHCGTCTKIKGYKLKRCLARHLHESKAHLNEAYICCEQRIKRKYDFKRHLKRHIMGEYGPVTTPPRCACGYLVDEQPDPDLEIILEHVEPCGNAGRSVRPKKKKRQ